MEQTDAFAKIILTHGAGSNREAPLLVALERAFQGKGVEAARYDLPFRQARPKGPPRPGDAARDQAGLNKQIEDAGMNSGMRLWLGGHSYGGRQASMLCAADSELVEALLLLSYPLHPPDKPEQKRTAHFPALRTPVLFVHGSKDPFGTMDEMNEALELIAGPKKLLEIAGVGHDLKHGRGGLAEEIASEFVSFAALFER